MPCRERVAGRHRVNETIAPRLLLPTGPQCLDDGPNAAEPRLSSDVMTAFLSKLPMQYNALQNGKGILISSAVHIQLH